MKRKIVMTGLMLVMTAMGLYANPNTNPDIRQVVVKNLEATQAEDMTAITGMMHTQSPSFEATKSQLPPLFKAYDLKYELLSFEFVAMSGEYAIGRTRQRTTKADGPIFRDNEIDMIQIFRKENGRWKFWAQSILTVTYL